MFDGLCWLSKWSLCMGLVGLPHRMVVEYHGQVERGKETEKDAAFYDLVFKVMQHLFCHIPFIKAVTKVHPSSK